MPINIRFYASRFYFLKKKEKKKASCFYLQRLRPCLFVCFFVFNHSSLLTQFSSLITHHSSLKIPQFPNIHPFGYCFQFTSLNYFYYFVGPTHSPKEDFSLPLFFFFFLRLSLEHLQDQEVELVKSTWGSWTLWSIYREMLPRALLEKQQSIPMPFYSPQKC